MLADVVVDVVLTMAMQVVAGVGEAQSQQRSGPGLVSEATVDVAVEMPPSEEPSGEDEAGPRLAPGVALKSHRGSGEGETAGAESSGSAARRAGR